MPGNSAGGVVPFISDWIAAATLALGILGAWVKDKLDTNARISALEAKMDLLIDMQMKD